MTDTPTPEQAARDLWEQYAQTGKESDFLMYARWAFDERDESMREAGRHEALEEAAEIVLDDDRYLCADPEAYDDRRTAAKRIRALATDDQEAE